MSPGLAGAAAGLGVAMPMGAMSVLLLQEAIRSRRAAVAGAAGIAVVDFGYAALAVAVGPWVASHVAPVEAWVRLAAATILLTIATHGLWPRPRTAGPEARPAATGGAAGARVTAGTKPRPAGPGPEGRAGGAGGARGAGRVFGRYVALTAVNPTTALYFAALTTAQGSELRSGAAATAFVGGVLLASLAWQQFLAAVGAFAGARISPTVRNWSFRLGYGLVAAYALKVALPLPWSA
ncbi:lysine transporter LysE [Streptomyces venezuelae]|uniref:Lysine transporter LysE n=2 Tax=Streptomyces venezuelae TaxID=54571 RepID=A0A5P2D895_STRVZ|nr:lysine transporter LysE [Streptomyces venezuelae]